ncbi:3-keto-5-aminohexanoate cleavage protein [Halorientalis litorea]|uniref:3-keto-5-aminohexanoate cleavage protein n=1 Tax=Halorientalis litorea TaxID=2931977 RepID=UPI001FF46062|nr:3-keto-5-aminohexanoate cleavage protein [Halorientalis litorea]
MTYETQDSIKGNDPDRAIISAALTGALTTRDQCESIPYTPEEIAEDAAAAREAGAAIAHIHARTENGTPSFEPEVYGEIYDEVRDRTDILINFSTGSTFDNLEKRLTYIEEIQPDIAALNMGSMNYAKYSESRDDFVFDMVFENSFDEIRELLRTMQDAGVKPEMECFDTGHINNAQPILKKGELNRPMDINLVMGVLGGIPATVDNLAHQVRQLPEDTNWQTTPIQEDQWPLTAASLAMGGNIRVGLEDNFYLPNGEMAEGNAELVEKAAEMVHNVGREPATPDEAREIMQLD